MAAGLRRTIAGRYRGGKRLARDLGQTRLLTMRGDNHTAYQGNSPCIDQHVEDYLINLALPPVGTTCIQDVPFEAPAQVQAQAKAQGLSKAQARKLQRTQALLRARPMPIG